MTNETKVGTQLDWRIVAIGIAALTIIECVALSNGINGTLMTFVIGIIAAAIGVAMPVRIK